LPAKNDNAVYLIDRVAAFAGKPRSYGIPRAAIVCGTIPATFSHTRIDNAHERPPHTKTCAQEA
jgi:putative methionine-R-sulfoxide reductase with GAF domain